MSGISCCGFLYRRITPEGSNPVQTSRASTCGSWRSLMINIPQLVLSRVSKPVSRSRDLRGAVCTAWIDSKIIGAETPFSFIRTEQHHLITIFFFSEDLERITMYLTACDHVSICSG